MQCNTQRVGSAKQIHKARSKRRPNHAQIEQEVYFEVLKLHRMVSSAESRYKLI